MLKVNACTIKKSCDTFFANIILLEMIKSFQKSLLHFFFFWLCLNKKKCLIIKNQLDHLKTWRLKAVGLVIC